MVRIVLVAAIALLIALFFWFDGGSYLSLEYFAEQRQALLDYKDQHFAASALLYFVIYTLVFALALPAGAVLTLTGGAIFGLVWGIVLVSFASSLGSLLAFLASRYLLRDWVSNRFASALKTINRGIEKEGAFYLFSLRLIPIFPPALINLGMGITRIKALTFYWVSQLGMLMGTAVYVNAGTQLGKIGGDQPILSSGLIVAFVLLGVLPLIAKRVVEFFQRRKAYKGFARPGRFDYNLVVIGAGSGGLVSAYIAATVNAKVALIERHKMGGDCLNTGCVPSKALLRSAKIAHYVDNANTYGINTGKAEVDFAAVMERVQSVISAIEPHDSVERYEGLGVECVQGEAEIVSPWEVKVGDKTLTTKNIIIASGARPHMIPFPGIEDVPVYNSDTIWDLRERPAKLMVVGAGPIGCELAQAFSRLGSEVTIIDIVDNVMGKEDPDVASYVKQRFLAEGINLALGHFTQRLEKHQDGYVLIAKRGKDGPEVAIEFTHLLMAVGRKANTENIGIDSVNIELNDNGTVQVDEKLRTNVPNIYAVGDVAGPYQFTHTASHMAWYATVNALFGRFRTFNVDYSVVPWATFTDPEVARVGLNETDAKEQGIDYEVTTYGIDDLDRAIADSEAHGFVKVITPKGNDRILGATIVGYHAGELINEFIATMKRKGKLRDIMGTIHIYPTLGEANKFAAGEYARAHKPERLLGWVEKYHRWSRS